MIRRAKKLKAPATSQQLHSTLDKGVYITVAVLVIIVLLSFNRRSILPDTSIESRATPDCTQIESKLNKDLLDSNMKALEAEKRLLDVEKRLVEADQKIIASETNSPTKVKESTSNVEANKAELEAEKRALNFEKRAVEAEKKIVELQKSITLSTALRGSSSSSSTPGLLFPTPTHPKAVNCNDIKMNTPMRITGMESIGKKYMVSYSWWGHRGSIKTWQNKKRSYQEMQQPTGNDSIRNVQKLINESPPGSAFLDIGANVGFMSFYAPVTGRPVYAFDPIQYDISKLCEGLLGNVYYKTFSWNMAKNVNIFHAAAGPEFKANVKIVRPNDDVGYFDQAALSAAAVKMAANQKVTENVPMMKIDDVIPDDVPVGAVKIDVQGHEEGVLIGMEKILSRKTGYPSAVLFEDDATMTRKTGWTYGNAKKILEKHGYKCHKTDVDQLCKK
jgi:FkbM family methyltransferase